MSQQPAGVPTNKLLDASSLQQQRRNGTLCDLLLWPTADNSTELKAIRCHKIILATVSPRFQRELTDETMHFCSKLNHGTLLALVEYMYAGEMTNGLTLENIYDVYHGAEEFDLEPLRTLCITEFASNLYRMNVVSALSTSLRENLWNFANLSLEYLLQHLDLESVKKEFLELKIGTIRSLLQCHNADRFVSTEELLKLVTTWLKNRCTHEQHVYSWEFIQDLPIMEIDKDHLINFFQQNQFLQQNENVKEFMAEYFPILDVKVKSERESPECSENFTKRKDRESSNITNGKRHCPAIAGCSKALRDVTTIQPLLKPITHGVIFCSAASSQSEGSDSYFLMKMSLENMNVENIGLVEGSLHGNSISYFGGNVITLGAGARNPGVDERPKQTFAQTFNIESRFCSRVPSSIQCRRSDSKTVLLGKHLYFLGGYTNAKISNRVDRLNVQSPFVEDWAWDAVAPMLTPRLQFGIATLDNGIYVVGGLAKSEQKGLHVSDKLECFDPQQNLWIEKKPMPTSRTGLAVTDAGKLIFAMGGCRVQEKDFNHRNMCNDVEIFDTETDTWNSGVPMLRKRKLFAAIVWRNHIYAIGGDTEDSPSVERFDFQTNTWTYVEKLPFQSKVFESVTIVD